MKGPKTLLLQSNGFQVARYVSLERLVEQSKEEYYGVLAECSQGWHEGKTRLVNGHACGVIFVSLQHKYS